MEGLNYSTGVNIKIDIKPVHGNVFHASAPVLAAAGGIMFSSRLLFCLITLRRYTM